MLLSVVSGRQGLNEGRLSQRQRRRALWMGLPAVVLSIVGMLAIYLAMADSSKLERRYLLLAENAGKEKQEKEGNFRSAIEIQRIAGQTPTATPAENEDVAGAGAETAELSQGQAASKQARDELMEVYQSERLFWEKLISINPKENDYLYQFALSCMAEGSFRRVFPDEDKSQKAVAESLILRGRSLMQTLAGQAQAGYAPAHLWWARTLQNLVLSGQLNREQAMNYARVALTHSEHYLSRELQGKEGLLIKGRMASLLERWQDAYDAFAVLFEDEPAFFREMTELNVRLKQADKNVQVYRRAKSKFIAQLAQDMPVDKWVNTIQSLSQTMVANREFEDLIKLLNAEKAKLETRGTDSFSEKPFLDQVLAKTYLLLQRDENSDITKPRQRDVDLVRQAHELDRSNEEVLRSITAMGFADDNAIAEAARAIYDPEKQQNLPATVSLELGTQALSRQQYEKSIEYLEEARRKGGRNGQLLNNLAYAYLVSPERRPERALVLIDEAIQLASADPASMQLLTFFHDTRGVALMQLNRMNDAIGSLELALRDRPDNQKIIELLIECYQATNLNAANYQQRLEDLKNK